jgi:hypothetical protein
MEFFIIGFLIGFFLAFAIIHFIANYVRKKRADILEKVTNDAIKTLKKTIIPSKIEEQNGMLFLYNSEDNTYLAQGTSLEELELNVKTRFPDKLFNVPQSEIDKYKKETI